MRNEILSLHTRLGVTTIYVTHDQQEALALSDRIVVLRSGLVQQVGKPSEVYSNPANLFVADFMGFKNLWDARIDSLKQTDSSLDITLDVKGMKLVSRLGYSKGDVRRATLVAAHEDGKSVKTAIRPEEIHIAGRGVPGNVSAKVVLVEYQGQTSYVSALVKNEITVEFRASQIVHVGDTVELSILPEKVFLFAENGR
jgi:putative spermidine/putrescine transport system ATP-binding protein